MSKTTTILLNILGGFFLLSLLVLIAFIIFGILWILPLYLVDRLQGRIFVFVVIFLGLALKPFISIRSGSIFDDWIFALNRPN